MPELASRSTALVRALALPLLATLLGCTGEDSIGVGDGRDGSRRDGGSMDASLSMDGALSDGQLPGAGDGSADGSASYTLPDGRVIDGDEDAGSEDELDPNDCDIFEEDDFEVTVPFVEGGFGVVPGALDFGLAYLREGGCRHAIDTAVIDTSGAVPMPVQVLQGCTMVEVAIGSSSDGYHLAWTDNSTGVLELHTAKLDDGLQMPASSRHAVTMSSAFERRPALSDVDGTPMVAWIAETGDDRGIFAQRLDDGAEAIEVVAAAGDHNPIELAFAPIGVDHAAIAWVDEVVTRGIWLQPLGADGMPDGNVLQMTNYAAPGSTVDLATRENEGGAAVYSIGIDQTNFEVRFRRLAHEGTFDGNEVKLISQPLHGKDAGIARLGGGYIIAYRAIPDGIVVQQSEIRVVFVSKEGNVNRDANGRLITFPVVPAAPDGSRIHVQVSVDGQLLIAFVDGSDQGENTLRLLRRRLDCGL